MGRKLERKTNPVLKDLVRKCEEASRVNDAPLWGRVAEELEKSARNRREVNVSSIERACEDGDICVVPGKVIGSGEFKKNVEVAALNFSSGARESIERSGKTLYLEEMVEEHPEGTGLRLVG